MLNPHAEASIREEVLDRDRHRDETGTWSTDTMQFQVGGTQNKGWLKQHLQTKDKHSNKEVELKIET